jgi:H+/gluconate symporter-like permease
MAIGRCGATWIIFGSAIVARPIIRVGYRAWLRASRTIDGGTFPPSPEEIEAIRQDNLDARSVQLFGPILAVLGTLLWGYGDLIGNRFIKCP